jgi:hypothetical protein
VSPKLSERQHGHDIVQDNVFEVNGPPAAQRL